MRCVIRKIVIDISQQPRVLHTSRDIHCYFVICICNHSMHEAYQVQPQCSILMIINSSLESGFYPAIFKHAVVQSLLKKPNLNPPNFNHFRPISELLFLSKVMSKQHL